MWSLQKAYRNMSNQLLWSGEPPPHVLEQQSATSFPPIERLFSDFQRTLLKPHRRSHFLVKPHLMASHPPVLMQTIGGIPPPPPHPFICLHASSQWGTAFYLPQVSAGAGKDGCSPPVVCASASIDDAIISNDHQLSCAHMSCSVTLILNHLHKLGGKSEATMYPWLALKDGSVSVCFQKWSSDCPSGFSMLAVLRKFRTSA